MSPEDIYQQRFTIRGRDFTNAGRVSTEIKEILKKIGIDSSIIRRAAIASYEAEMNVVMYAREGWMDFSITPRELKMTLADEGPGIEDIDLAMQEGYSTATEEMREMGFGAGMGLPNIKKNSDELKITSTVGKGTELQIIIYMPDAKGAS